MMLAWFVWICPAPVDVEVSLLDLHALPPHAVAELQADFAQKHCEWVVGAYRDCALAGDRRLEARYNGWCVEATWRRDVWRLLENASDEKQAKVSRLIWLERLREELGRNAFYGGVMPAPVPLMRFTRAP
jgi:hypothetical protein